MSDIQTGAGVVQGVANDGTAISITGYATFLLKKTDLEHRFDLTEIKDAGGEDATLLAKNEHQEIEIDFVLSGATRAAAAATGVFITPLTKVTLAHFKISAFNGDYTYVGGAKINLADVEQGRLTGLRLRKYADSTRNTSLTTTVSG